MWNVVPTARWDWAALRASILEHGVRNSLLVAPMPTASTSQILGNNECFEPYTSNIYTRRVLAGEFVIVNRYVRFSVFDSRFDTEWSGVFHMSPALRLIDMSLSFRIFSSLLLTDLMKLGLWDEKMKNAIIAANGSVAGIPEIPDDLKAIYKTVWEISQRKLVRHRAAALFGSPSLPGIDFDILTWFSLAV